MSVERCEAELARIRADMLRDDIPDSERFGLQLGELDWMAEKMAIEAGE